MPYGRAIIEADGVRDLIPFVHVSDLASSIAFYQQLGFSVTDTHEREGELDWAALQAESARIMLVQAGAPIDGTQQAVLFYLYADDLAALRERLVADGMAVGEIRDGTPGPKREMRIADPDGYCLMVAQIEG